MIAHGHHAEKILTTYRKYTGTPNCLATRCWKNTGTPNCLTTRCWKIRVMELVERHGATKIPAHLENKGKIQEKYWNRHFCAEKYEQRAQNNGAAYFRAWCMLDWQVHGILGTRGVSTNTVASEG